MLLFLQYLAHLIHSTMYVPLGMNTGFVLYKNVVCPQRSGTVSKWLGPSGLVLYKSAVCHQQSGTVQKCGFSPIFLVLYKSVVCPQWSGTV